MGLEIEETLRRLTERYSESCHICYSEFPVADDIALRCKKSGAAYLICNLNTDAERKRLETSVALGRPYYPATISGLERKAEHAILARSSALTVRQHTVLRYALSGKTLKETAANWG